MKFLIDMNLSPSWVGMLTSEGFEAIHWSEVGDPRAKDELVLAWARTHDCVLLTSDLDFGAILAASGTTGPSVLQMRTQDLDPARLSPMVAGIVRQHVALLRAGALITVEEFRNRIRVLPLRS